MNKNETRWGILVLAIFMFFVTLVVADVNGTKNPFYLYVWVMMGYFAYRGEVLKINKWMLALIWLNVFIMFMVAIFMGDKSVGSLYRGWSSKETILIGVCIMLVPKVILYFYTNSLLDTKSNDEKSTSNVVENSASKNVVNSNMKTVMEDDNQFWEKASYELSNNIRNEAIWARLFSEADGDENKTKARYLKHRVEELKGKAIEANQSESEKNLQQEERVERAAVVPQTTVVSKVDAEKERVDIVVTIFKVFMALMFVVTLLIIIFL